MSTWEDTCYGIGNSCALIFIIADSGGVRCISIEHVKALGIVCDRLDTKILHVQRTHRQIETPAESPGRLVSGYPHVPRVPTGDLADEDSAIEIL